MKKSSIPDFAPRPKGSATSRATTGEVKPEAHARAPHGAKSAAPPRAPSIKPQATSAKSGRRGA